MEMYPQIDNDQQGSRDGNSDWKRILLEERHARPLSVLETAFRRFSSGERLALYLLTTLLFLSALVMLADLDAAASVVVPAAGGTLIEGETGPARFINPILAVSQADQDLSELVYSGLMRALPDGSIVPDLAQSYGISSNGSVYTFRLRPDAAFQDGSPVTAADVLFTVQEVQNPAINSPRRADWTGVTVSSPDPETVVFTLPHAYAPFIEDTAFGILPKKLWQNTSAEEFPFSPLNTHPIGSGPYKIARVTTDATGSASRYDLVPFANFTLGTPYLSHISFVFFGGQDALVKALDAGTVNAAAGIASADLANVTRADLFLTQAPLPRVFGVFLNQSHNPVLADPVVRAALDAAVDKQRIISQSLGGRGTVLDSPIPPGSLSGSAPATPQRVRAQGATGAAASGAASAFAQKARTILQGGGWTFDQAGGVWTKKSAPGGKKTLSLTLVTADQPELIATAKELAQMWQAAGIQVTTQVYPLAQLNTNVIRPRNYDALLFGEVVGPQLDLYAFWHSSQRNDPGLNLALYANSKTDALLSQARGTTDQIARNKLYEQFASILVKDRPAIFLYAPDFLYVTPKDLSGVELGALENGSDRFAGVYRWYTDTEYVWAIFAPSAPLEASPKQI